MSHTCSFSRMTALAALGVLLPFGLPALAQTTAPTPDADALPVEVAPTDSLLRYVGRFDTSDKAGPRCSWSASTVELKFRGSGLNVRLNESGNSDEYQVVVDGKTAAVLMPRGGTHLYSVFQSSMSGTHTVALVKRTEAFFGISQFQGFQLSTGGRLLALPPRPRRSIEIIGDSISCGYGNEAKDQHEHFSSVTENAFLAYGAVAARDLGAEYVCIAWSGRTMWPKNTMAEVYDRTLPTDPNSRWNFSRWTPNAVVVSLGTNDFAGPIPDEAAWTAGYEAFLAHIRRNYPRAVIYCASSPMLLGDKDRVERSYLHQIVADENAAGDKDVRFLDFKTQDGKNGFGADWHPSLKTDALMAQTMVSALRADLGWTAAATETKAHQRQAQRQ